MTGKELQPLKPWQGALMLGAIAAVIVFVIAAGIVLVGWAGREFGGPVAVFVVMPLVVGAWAVIAVRFWEMFG